MGYIQYTCVLRKLFINKVQFDDVDEKPIKVYKAEAKQSWPQQEEIVR